MKKHSKRALAALAVSALVGFSSPAAIAATTTVGIYGVWSTPTYNAETFTYSGEIAFEGAHVTGATYTVTYFEDLESNYAEPDSPTSKGDWITNKVDMGKVFGANGPSADNTLLVTGVASDTAGPTYNVEIIFDEPVAASELGLSAIDLDVDHAAVAMYDAEDNPLTGAQIKGTASTPGFNICSPVATSAPDNCDGETSPGVVSVGDAQVNFNEAEDEEDQGAAAWVRPSAQVKRIFAIADGSSGGSSLRWVVAIKGDKVSTANKAELANTGTSPVLPIYAAITIAAGAVIVSRRSAKA